MEQNKEVANSQEAFSKNVSVTQNDDIVYGYAESVGIGHPDKICDAISDAVLDEALKQDPKAHVACETVAMNNLIIVGGEINTSALINVAECVWSVIIPLGYDYHEFTIISNLNQQSAEINAKVSKEDEEVGAGDQGIVIGYATSEGSQFGIKNHNYLPLESVFANGLMKYLQDKVRNKSAVYSDSLGFDAKTLITVLKDNKTNKATISRVILSLQHKELNKKDYKALLNSIKLDAISYFKEVHDIEVAEENVFVNEAGTFILGGPKADSGLTGRKIVVDAYGPSINVGGGAFSGKDASKVDRSGAYLARWIAKSLVAGKYCTSAKVTFTYEIGSPTPTYIKLDVSNAKPGIDLEALIKKNFDNLDLHKNIVALGLTKPIFSKFDNYSHFSNKDAPWEKVKKLVE